jgi:cytochrome c oxidase subunit 2
MPVALAILALVLSACAGSGPQSAIEPQSPQADGINDLWLLVYYISVVIFVLVMGALIVVIVRFRERPGDDRQPVQLHGNTALEITWTIIPAVILAVVAVPTVRGVFELREAPSDDNVINISVTGHQWWWEFEYADYTNAAGEPLVTANELHLPVGKEAYFVMTSADVIHSFWVPPLNGKRDVVPGRITTLSFEPWNVTPPGQPIFGQCAEFCGLAHADMRMRVFVHTEEGFADWMAAESLPAPVPTDGAELAGWETFNTVCTACHQATVDNEGTIETLGPSVAVDAGEVTFVSSLAPNLTHFGSRTTFAAASYANTVEHLAAWLDDPPALKPMDPDRNDIAEGEIFGMPDFNLNEDEIAGLIALLRLWE